MRWLLLLVLLPPVAWAEVYKCPDGKGGQVYRDNPCSGAGSPLEMPTAPSEPSAAFADDYQRQIHAAMITQLYDPGSRQVEFKEPFRPDRVCGAVNARNRFGGYVGRQGFIARFVGGKLTSLKIYNAEEMAHTFGVDHYTLVECGLLGR